MRRIRTAAVRALVVIVVIAVWIVRSNSRFEETFYTIESYKIEEPVRVILLADLHQGSFGKNNETLIARVQALKPDIIVLAGDMVNKKNPAWDNIIRLCAALAELAPVYYGLGNHENEALYGEDLNKAFLDPYADVLGDPPEELKVLLQNAGVWDQLEAAGVRLLQNEAETVQIKGNTIHIGGISTNVSSFWPYSGQFITDFMERDPEELHILISHRPEVAVEYLSGTAIDLVLSGHNHGGVIRIPGLGGLASEAEGLFPTYDGGWYDLDGTALLVSRGLGGHGLVPRVFNPPELVIVDLN